MNEYIESPLFIRGVSRSGGTLLVTICDAHPDVSMSYELYPNLLDSLTNDSRIKFFGQLLSSEAKMKKTYKGDDHKLKTFVARCYRSGLNSIELYSIFNLYIESTLTPFSNSSEKMEFIACCARAKMKKEGKKKWGMKCNTSYSQYLEKWPNACFVNIIRDGRDVLASQLNTGSFNKTVRQTAEGYLSSHQKFLKWQEDSSFNGFNLIYEELAFSSSSTLQKMCAFIGIPFNLKMLNYYQEDLTIFKNSMGHLSRDRINKPIDSSKIGRWKLDLKNEQVIEFENIASPILKKFGYIF